MRFKKIILMIIALALVVWLGFYLTNYFEDLHKESEKDRKVLSEIDRLFTDEDYLNNQVEKSLTFTSSKACAAISDNANKYGWSRGKDQLYTDGGSYQRDYTSGTKYGVVRSLQVYCKYSMVSGQHYEAYVTVK